MKLLIGENIRRLRTEKNVTQEQLAAFLSVSGAAVSKWERGESYPDIVLLPAIAQFFEVTLDQLVGYDAEKTAETVKETLSECRRLRQNGLFSQASRMLDEALEQPQGGDYRILSAYLFDRMGSARGDFETVLAHGEEIAQISDQILNGCTNEVIRLNAIYAKAKLLAAKGNTAAAIHMLDMIPPYQDSRNERLEQLFSYDNGTESRYRQLNLFVLARLLGDKLSAELWSLGDSSRGEVVGDALENLYHATGETVFLCLAYYYWNGLALKLTAHWGDPQIITCLRSKQFALAESMDQRSGDDDVLKEMLTATYDGKSVVSALVEFLEIPPQKTFQRMRKYAPFVELISRYKQ